MAFAAAQRQETQEAVQETPEIIQERPSWINPVTGYITSLFGWRTNPVTHSAEFHNGIDIAVPIGTPVLAVRDAQVVHVGESALNGIYMRLRCLEGYDMVFAHLSQALVGRYEKVTQGQTVALSGNTGQSTGPHLHYGLFRNGQRVDPLYRVELNMAPAAARAYAERQP